MMRNALKSIAATARRAAQTAGLTLPLLFWGAASAVEGQELIGPRLGAAANFSQGWRPDILDAAAQIPVLDFRDTVHWAVAEKPGKRFDFRGWRTAFPGILKARDLELGLFLNANHQAYDNGETAHSDAAVAAFGDYAARVVSHYRNIRSVEMGNEFNGEDFVSGPARTSDMDARAGYYVALLKSLHGAVKAVDPSIRITGGGVHSIPVDYLRRFFAQGGAAYMDALAIHTYTTPAEHLVRQIAVLRSLPEARTLPLEVTEFGTLSDTKAPGLFLRNYCQMALSGVDRAVWYPLHPRGDGLIPLLQDDGTVTNVGRAYGFAQAEFAGLPVQDVAPDPFTYACLFGGRKLVLWGEPRHVTISPGIRAFTAEGVALDGSDIHLSRNDPVVLVKDGPLAFERDLALAPTRVVADSFHQLEYPGYSRVSVSSWHSFIDVDGTPVSFETLPGQERQGVPWVPYLGHADFSDLRLAADFLVPTYDRDKPVSVVQQFTADAAMSVEIDAYWHVSDQSEDGILLTILRNDEVLSATTLRGQTVLSNRRVDLSSGDRLAFRIGPNGNPWGDYTEHRITLRRNASADMPALGGN